MSTTPRESAPKRKRVSIIEKPTAAPKGPSSPTESSASSLLDAIGSEINIGLFRDPTPHRPLSPSSDISTSDTEHLPAKRPMLKKAPRLEDDSNTSESDEPGDDTVTQPISPLLEEDPAFSQMRVDKEPEKDMDTPMEPTKDLVAESEKTPKKKPKKGKKSIHEKVKAGDGQPTPTAKADKGKGKEETLDHYPTPGQLSLECYAPKWEPNMGPSFISMSHLPVGMRWWFQDHLDDFVTNPNEAPLWVVVSCLVAIPGKTSYETVKDLLAHWVGGVYSFNGGWTKPHYLCRFRSPDCVKRMKDFGRLFGGVYLGAAKEPGALLIYEVKLKESEKEGIGSLLMEVTSLPPLTKFPNFLQFLLKGITTREVNNRWGITAIKEPSLRKWGDTSITGGRILEVVIDKTKVHRWLRDDETKGITLEVTGWKSQKNVGSNVYNSVWKPIVVCMTCGLPDWSGIHKPKCPFLLIRDEALLAIKNRGGDLRKAEVVPLKGSKAKKGKDKASTSGFVSIPDID